MVRRKVSQAFLNASHRKKIENHWSRLQQTVVINYERHAAYERINAKTGKHEKTEKTVRDKIVRITGFHLLAY